MSDPQPTPGNANGEVLDGPNVNQAVVGVAYDSPAYSGSGSIVADGLNVTLSVTGGPPGETAGVVWGDPSAPDDVVLDDAGAATLEHIYAEAGDYTVTVGNEAGAAIYSTTVTATAPPEPEPEPEGLFDPGDHTVADVEAYVAAHPDERDRIIAAEQAGKNRSTLLDALGAS